MYQRIVLISALFTLISAAIAQPLDKVVAVVNNGVITSSELNKQVALTKKQLLAQNAPVPPEKVLQKQVLQQLITINLQLQMAKEHGINVDDAELNQAIEKIAALNRASLSEMREEIARQGVNWKEYRENIRKEIVLSNLQQKAVAREIMVTNEQVEHYLKTEGEGPIDRTRVTYHLQNLVIPLNDEPTPEQLKKAHQVAALLLKKTKKDTDLRHLAIEQSNAAWALEAGDLGERHLPELPELFAKEVTAMKVGQTIGPLRAGNGLQLIKLVAINGDDSHHIVALTHVRHILLKPDANMLPDDAKKQVNNIFQQLKAGKDFATMAKHYSLDPASAAKGGDLGWVGPGELVPEFEKTMNQLALNQVSRPVKTQFGWHLIEVLGRKHQDDSVAYKKQQVRQHLQQRKFAEAVQNWQQHIRADAFVNILEKELA